jgi:hypothetical protein
LDTIFQDKAHDPQELAARSAVYGLTYCSVLIESQNPSKDVSDFCQAHRTACSSHGKSALQKLDTGSQDYFKVVDWLKQMALWLNRADAAARNLAISPQSQSDLVTAGECMGLLFAFHQSLELVLE